MAPWGITWAPIIREAADATLVACVDSNPETLAAAQSHLDLPTTRCFSTLETALAAVPADAVLITASIGAHASLALTALAAGMHVLLEKPFAATLADAERVVAAAADAGRILMISQNYRFQPAPRTVAALIRGNILGSVGNITIDFRQNAATLLPQEHALYRMPQPLLAEIGVHHFDLLRMVLGDEAAHITCQAWNPPWSTLAGPAAATATITCAGGTIANYRGSWASHALPTPWAGIWRMECTGGEIVWTSRNGSNTNADLVIVRQRGQPARRVVLPKLRLRGRAACLAAFTSAIRTGQPPECSGRDNLGTIALMQSAISAATSGQPQVLPPTIVSLPWASYKQGCTSRIRASAHRFA
ncbi:MAG TPA: Gfo/Idh/MocA family oxidoreductase [Herpetosiphonaceae bacterium]